VRKSESDRDSPQPSLERDASSAGLEPDNRPATERVQCSVPPSARVALTLEQPPRLHRRRRAHHQRDAGTALRRPLSQRPLCDPRSQ